MPEEVKISPAMVIIPLGLGLGLVTVVGIYALSRAAPPFEYRLTATCIEDATGFPVAIQPDIYPRTNKITAGVPVTLWQFLENRTGEPLPSWSINARVTYPDGTVQQLDEIGREEGHWPPTPPLPQEAYAKFSPFIPTFEDIYSLVEKRTYTVNLALLINGEVVDELSVKLIAQAP